MALPSGINVTPDILQQFGSVDPEHSDLGMQFQNAVQGAIPGSPNAYFWNPGEKGVTDWASAMNAQHTQTFGWERPQDGSGGNLLKGFLTSAPVLMALSAFGGQALAGAGEVGEAGMLGGVETGSQINPAYYSSGAAGAGAVSSGGAGSLAGLDSSVSSIEPYAYMEGAPGSIGTAGATGGLGAEGLTTPDVLQGLSSVGGGVPVTEMGKAFTGFGTGNGIGSDTSAIVKSILGLTGAGGGGGGGGGILPLLSLGSGAYGMYQANQLRRLAKEGQMNIPGANGSPAISGSTSAAISQSDPWGTSGGRALADSQLQALLKDPSGVTKLPGYEAGLEAVQRSMAAQGYVGSGNMMAALQKYGGDFYNNAISQLSSLGAATQNPATMANLGLNADQLQISGATAGANVGLQGNVAANDLVSKSLASIGYGATGGNQNNILTPQLLALLSRLGVGA